MIVLFLFALALIFATVQLSKNREWGTAVVTERYLSYFLLFSIGCGSLLGAVGHLFMGPEIAAQIGWPAGSPFQFEIGMANLAFAVLGILSFWIRGHFWTATIIGWAVFVLGCFAGHLIDYVQTGNISPYNMGLFIWLYDLVLPILFLGLLRRYLTHTE